MIKGLVLTILCSRAALAGTYGKDLFENGESEKTDGSGNDVINENNIIKKEDGPGKFQVYTRTIVRPVSFSFISANVNHDGRNKFEHRTADDDNNNLLKEDGNDADESAPNNDDAENENIEKEEIWPLNHQPVLPGNTDVFHHDVGEPEKPADDDNLVEENGNEDEDSVPSNDNDVDDIEDENIGKEEMRPLNHQPVLPGNTDVFHDDGELREDERDRFTTGSSSKSGSGEKEDHCSPLLSSPNAKIGDNDVIPKRPSLIKNPVGDLRNNTVENIKGSIIPKANRPKFRIIVADLKPDFYKKEQRGPQQFRPSHIIPDTNLLPPPPPFPTPMAYSPLIYPVVNIKPKVYPGEYRHQYHPYKAPPLIDAPGPSMNKDSNSLEHVQSRLAVMKVPSSIIFQNSEIMENKSHTDERKSTGQENLGMLFKRKDTNHNFRRNKDLQESASVDENPAKEPSEVNEKSESQETHETETSEKGEKSYKRDDEHEKLAKGHHDKESHQGEYQEEREKSEKHHKGNGFFGEHKKEEKGKKAKKYGEGKKHKKGRSTHGEHKILKKDEYMKTTIFYDEDHDDGELEERGEFEGERFEKNGENKDGGYHEESQKKSKNGKKGHQDKGKDEEESKGFDRKKGQAEHYGHGNSSSQKKSRKSKKKRNYEKN